MKNLLITICLVIFTLLTACKKSTTTTNPSPTNNSTATITPISRASFYNGIFSFVQVQTVLSTHPLTYSYSATANAIFRTGDSLHYKNVIVSSVTVDSVAAAFRPDTSYNTPNVTGASCSWKIAGAGIIPSFIYTSTKLPNVLSALPDTIDHTKPLSLFVQLNGGYLIDVFVGNSSVFNGTFADTATYNFTTANFSTLTPGANTIQVESQTNDLISVNGLPMNFYLKRIFVKPVYIK